MPAPEIHKRLLEYDGIYCIPDCENGFTEFYDSDAHNYHLALHLFDIAAEIILANIATYKL